jgi:hypothetical protein
VRQEVLPLKPDLLVYYEGANQFDLSSIATGLPDMPTGLLLPPGACPAQPAVAAEAGKSEAGWWSWLGHRLGEEFALVRRVQALVAARDLPADGGEWPKADIQRIWPAGLDERDPDIGRPDLPMTLSTIVHDLDAIRGAAKQSGAELVLASFFWLVKDGMMLDPIRHRTILEYLNGYAPFRYRDMERMAAFQNRVFAKYASAHKLAFIDIAKLTPFDPDLFVDGIHTTYAGERLRAWIFFQQLLPIVESHLKSGAWPRQVAPSDVPPPIFKARPITFDCKRRG